MKIVVTGGCGYIGSHVARAFKTLNNDEVIVIDTVERTHTLKGLDGYLIADFASDEALSYIVMHEPDVVVHCAGTSLVGPSMTEPSTYYNNNVVKTVRMMDVIKNMKHRPVVLFSSSASVYGVPESLPISEYARIQPISPYGNTKATDERILHDYSSAYGIDTICFRYFNAAGAEPMNFDLGQEPDATHIVARALEASIRGSGFTINGKDCKTPDGTCIRDYVHVWDIAVAHLRGVGYLQQGHGLVVRPSINEVFNLGTNKGISNLEIVEYVNKKYGLGAVEFGPKRFGDPDELVADATRAREVLGWVPQFSNIENIVDSAYNWYTRK
jgi:UDP-glucose 4-epimerase